MNKLNHPCKGTCSGWQQGYESGRAEMEAENARLREALERFAAHDEGCDYTAGCLCGASIARAALEGK